GMVAMEKLIRATRYAVVMATWLTAEEKGFWATAHSGVPFYFFSRRDLLQLQPLHPKGRFLLTDFIPESQSTQPNSYVGVSPDRLEQIGSGNLIYTSLTDSPGNYPVLEL